MFEKMMSKGRVNVAVGAGSGWECFKGSDLLDKEEKAHLEMLMNLYSHIAIKRLMTPDETNAFLSGFGSAMAFVGGELEKKKIKEL